MWASLIDAAVGALLRLDPAALGDLRYGGFHMTAPAGDGDARPHQRNAVVIVLDNGLYAYEQFLINPGYFGHPIAVS